ncbi:HIT family protein [Streptomyces sp. NPDC006552]|uniref:HIT family protein n=1 Tax=Streptomyces sp. NPDC006552 TaxID=3157179 RepID=UPI00339DEC49
MTSDPPALLGDRPATPDCYACGNEARFTELPPRERIAFDPHWRLAHAVGTALPGWLVLLPRRHVSAVHDLTDAEAGTLGGWQVRAARALREVTGCAKTYVAQFAEAEGFTHVHVHLVPRSATLDAARRGPRVFAYLRHPEAEHVSADDADALAHALRAHL